MTYPADWNDIATRVKTEAGWKCIRCGHAHEVTTGHVLTVHHLDMDPSNCRWWNLVPLCQRCHLQIQAKVQMHQRWMFDHRDWFKPYVAGFYAWKYLGEELTRDEAEQRIEELLAL